MFWNSEFLNTSTSQLDVLLQMQTLKLSDILFEEDLLQELKTSNISLASFLIRPEVVGELVDNITQLTEKDCCDKSLYSRVHAAYISCEILTSGSSEIFAALMNHPDSLSKILNCLTVVVPQKATLVSKLISTIHTLEAANLSCHITRDIDSFSKLIDLLINNIDISGSFEILSTFIKPTIPSDLRYVFCELLSKLNFVHSLIDVMTLSDFEDKQRNACQLLCDIIVVGRQVASEQSESGPIAQDMLTELLESNHATCKILQQMFSNEMRNTTAIVSGMKVLQTLLEQKSTTDEKQIAKTIKQIQGEIEKHLINFHELLLNPPKQEPIKTTFGVIQKPLGYMRLEVVNYIRALLSTNSSEITKKLIELRTMRVIIDLFIEYSWNNLLHTQVEQALCLIIKNCRNDEDLNYHIEIQKHNHLNSMCEQHIPMQSVSNHSDENSLHGETDNIFNHDSNNATNGPNELKLNSSNETASVESTTSINIEGDTYESKNREASYIEQDKEKEQEIRKELVGELKEVQGLEIEKQEEEIEEEKLEVEGGKVIGEKTEEVESGENEKQNSADVLEENEQVQSTSTISLNNSKTSHSEMEIPSRALLSQLLNECDLISKLLLTPENKSDPSDNLSCAELERLRRRNGEKANFGHIVQMINSIAINRDLDTISDHLSEMRESRPDLYARWTTFVNVDVASFKTKSLYYDALSNNNVSLRFNTDRFNEPFTKPCDNDHQDQSYSYLTFTTEAVLPVINIDVLPKPRLR